MQDPDSKMNAANAMAPASQEEYDEMMARATSIGNAVARGERPNENYDPPADYVPVSGGRQYDSGRHERNCECGNHCYEVGAANHDTGEYEVKWAHHPAECPHDCEDCEQEAMG